MNPDPNYDRNLSDKTRVALNDVQLIVVIVLMGCGIHYLLMALVRTLMPFIICAAVCLAFVAPARAEWYEGQIVNVGGQVQQLTREWYTDRYGCRHRRWKWIVLADYRSADWKNRVLDILDRQKERELFDDTLRTLGVANLMAPSHAGYAASMSYASQAGYPSAAGQTLGGFASLSYSRYGDVATFDVNRANELVSARIDEFNRAAAANGAQANQITSGVGSLIQLNASQVGAVAEQQELRATIRELATGMANMQSGFAAALAAARPGGAESLEFHAESGEASSSDGQTSQWHAPLSAPGDWSLVSRYCGACHAAGVAATNGAGFTLDESLPIDPRALGAAEFRLSGVAPVKRANGAPGRMPPEGSPQPSADELRSLVEALRANTRLD